MDSTQKKSDFTLIQTIHPPFDDFALVEAQPVGNQELGLQLFFPHGAIPARRGVR